MDYEALTDEKLAALAREGDDGAMEVLLLRYKSLVRQISRSYLLLTGGDPDDLIQTGMIALTRAVTTFDESKASFKTFATLCVRNRIYDYLKGLPPKNLSLTDYDTLLVAALSDPEEIYIAKEGRKNILGRIRELFSNDEIAVLKLFLEGRSYTEIALIRGISPKKVDNSLQKIRKSLKKKLENDNR